MRACGLVLLMLATFPGAIVAQEDHVFVYVDDDATGPGSGTLADPFPTIQSAVNYVWPHDFILVRPGVYHEAVILPWFVFLLSTDGPEVTIIDATGQPGTVAISMDALCEVVGLTIVKLDGGGVEQVVPSSAPDYGSIVRGNRIVGCPAGALRFAGPTHPFVFENVLIGNGAFGLKIEDGASPLFHGNTVNANAAGLVKAGLPPDGTESFANNIVWGNGVETAGFTPQQIRTSDIEDPAFAGINGNFNADPLFVDPAAFDLRLQAGSPCVDTGDTTQVFFSSTFDWRGYGALRKMDGDHDGLFEVDVGALERGGLQVRQIGTGAGSTVLVELDTGPWTQWFLAGGVLGINPTLPLAGAYGYLFLEDWSLILLGSGAQGASGTTTLAYPILDPAWIGQALPLQALSLNYAGPGPLYTFTTAEFARIR